ISTILALRACGGRLCSRPSNNLRPRRLLWSEPRSRSRMLAGRTIVITGAARGVGRAIAHACARAGARLVLGDVLEGPGRAVADELSNKGAAARFVPIDLNEPGSIAAFAQDVAQREGRVHGLVNNAAIATDVGGKAFDEIDLDLWDRVMRVNVRGTWLV